jgi:hypothetical protein
MANSHCDQFKPTKESLSLEKLSTLFQPISPDLQIFSFIMDCSDPRQIISTDPSSASDGEIAKSISSAFGFVPDSSEPSLACEGKKNDCLRNIPLDDQLNKAPGIPGFIKELLTYKNQLYLWSNVSIFPKNLSVPADIYIHIFTKDIVEELRFEDIYGMVIHQSPQSRELSWPARKFLSSLFQEDLRNLKILVFLYGFLNNWWLTDSMLSCKLDILCVENCVYPGNEFLEKFVSVDKLYLTPCRRSVGSTNLPLSLNHLEISCPKSEETDPEVLFSVSAEAVEKLRTM